MLCSTKIVKSVAITWWGSNIWQVHENAVHRLECYGCQWKWGTGEQRRTRVLCRKPTSERREEAAGLPRTIPPSRFTSLIRNPCPLAGAGGESHLQGRESESGKGCFFSSTLTPLTSRSSHSSVQDWEDRTSTQGLDRCELKSQPAFFLTGWTGWGT